MEPAVSLIFFSNSACCRKAAKRLTKQAQESGYFRSVTGFDEDCLEPAFRRRLGNRLNSKVRGFGYWVWKPQVVLQGLEDLSEGEILLYVDVGCHIARNQSEGLTRYVDLVRTSPTGILCSELSLPEKDWTKGDVFDYFGVRNSREITESPQRQAGVVFYVKSPKVVDFIEKWGEVCSRFEYLIDDSASRSPNLPGFIEHRHDQSVFSVLSKMYGVSTFGAWELMEWSLPANKRQEGSFPIETRRDKRAGLSATISSGKGFLRNRFSTIYLNLHK